MTTQEILESLDKSLAESKIFYELDDKIYYFTSDIAFDGFKAQLVKEGNFKGSIVSKDYVLEKAGIFKKELTEASK